MSGCGPLFVFVEVNVGGKVLQFWKNGACNELCWSIGLEWPFRVLSGPTLEIWSQPNEDNENVCLTWLPLSNEEDLQQDKHLF